MVDLSGAKNARPIIVNTEIKGELKDYADCPWFIYKATEEGVYQIEVSNDSVERIDVIDRDESYNTVTRFEEQRKDLFGKKNIESFYLEKGKTYLINLIARTDLRTREYYFKFKALEVPSHNYREIPKEWNISEKIENKLLYKQDEDWYVFKVPEDGEYKVVYSKLVNQGLYFYEKDSKTPYSSSALKLELMDDSIEEEFMFYSNNTYYMRVIVTNKLGDYSVKMKQSGISVTYFDKL